MSEAQTLVLLTEREACRLLKISARHLFTLRNEHGLPFIRMGARRILYDPQALADWVRSRTEAVKK